MTYKKKIIVLSSITAALAITYILSIVFDPERRGARSAAYSWLDPAQNNRISWITIVNPQETPQEIPQETITLTRNNAQWFVSHNGKDYPARQSRVEDLIAALNKRAPYPVRSSSASSHERLSLAEGVASRITVMGNSGPPLLSLLIGQEDITGQNVYLRRQGENQVRSGQDIFSIFTSSTLTSWYNLRLFPERETGRLDVEDIQRLTVYPPANDNGNAPPQLFTRSGKDWTFNFALADPDMEMVNRYIRDILNTSGDDFTNAVTASDSIFNTSRIILELGNGTIRTVRLGPPADDGSRYAVVSGSDWVYSIPAWTGQRLFLDTVVFEKED